MLGTVSAVLVQPVWAAVPEPARDDFLGKCDLTPAVLADPDARVSPAQLCIAWAELIRVTGQPAIALAIADATPVGAFGVVEYLCRSQPTLGAALEQWVRYLNLLDDAVVVGLVPEGDDICLRVLAESEAPAPASHELCFALVMLQARGVCRAPVRPTSVDFTHTSRVDPAIYSRWFDATVRFEAPQTQLVLSRATMSAPLVTADGPLSDALARFAHDRQTNLQAHTGLLADVRRYIRAGLQVDDANIEAVARRAGMTARSLQRRLKEDGTSFSDLREDVRRELADRYIGEGLSIAEISFLLGFSEPSAFFRAFKRWTGTTPLEHRARLAG